MRHCVPKNRLNDKTYRQIFRMVDGGVQDYINCHPQYFPKRLRGAIRNGLGKRIAGSMKGYFAQAKLSRSESNQLSAARKES